jgi:hypothetical protein
MQRNGLVEEAGMLPAGKSDRERMHYRLTQEGTFRLKEELKRLEHAVEIGREAGLMDDDIPIEIQRIIEAAR